MLRIALQDCSPEAVNLVLIPTSFQRLLEEDVDKHANRTGHQPGLKYWEMSATDRRSHHFDHYSLFLMRYNAYLRL